MKSHDFHVMMQNNLPLCMWHLMTKGCRMAIICLSHVFKNLCQNCGLENNGWSQAWCGGHTIITKEKKSSFLWYHDTPFSSFSWGTKNLCCSAYTLNVSCGTLYENIKSLCEKQRKAQRQHGRRLHHKGNIRILHIILMGFYSHKMKHMGWQRRPMYFLWGGWRKWVPMIILCRSSKHSPLFCPSKCGSSWWLVIHYKP